MSEIEELESKILQFEFDVEIDSSIEKVWNLISTEIDRWWMKDFRALGEGSKMALNLEPGGALHEVGVDGAVLEWYRVQMWVPNESIYLTGYLAPDWGGPTVSMLKLALSSKGDGCVLTVSDALLGNVTDSKAANVLSGWKQMFGDGLKATAEANIH